MKKNLLKSLLTVTTLSLAAFSASAINFNPPQGEINLESSPGGAGSFELTGFSSEVKVNREVVIDISLYRNGEILTTINTSDSQAVQMIEGFDKVEYGLNAVICFYPQQDNPATKAGEYTLTIPKGTFLYKDGSEVEEITGEWSIVGASFSINPENRSTLNTISVIELTIEGATEVEFTDNTEVSEQTDDEGNTVTVVKPALSLVSRTSDKSYLPVSTEVKGDKFIITFPEVTAPGTYDFTVKSGCLSYVTKEGKKAKNIQIDAIYYVEKVIPKPVITPAEGTFVEFRPDAIHDGMYAYFHLTFDENVSYILTGQATLTPEGSNAAIKTFSFVRDQSDRKSLYLVSSTVSERTENETLKPKAGKYILKIPAKMLQFESMQRNPVFTFEYTIEDNGQSRIEAVETAETADVYTVTGIRILKDATQDDIRALDKGIYIINGKKIAR